LDGILQIGPSARAGRDTGSLLAAQAGQAFLLTPADQPTAFVQAVAQIVADSSLRIRLQERGAAFFQSNFTWEGIASQLAAVLLSHAR